MSDSEYRSATIFPPNVEAAFVDLDGSSTEEIRVVVACWPFGRRAMLEAFGLVKTDPEAGFEVNVAAIRLLITMIVRTRGLYDAVSTYSDPAMFTSALTAQVDPTSIAKDAMKGTYLASEDELRCRMAAIRSRLSADPPARHAGMGGFEHPIEPLL